MLTNFLIVGLSNALACFRFLFSGVDGSLSTIHSFILFWCVSSLLATLRRLSCFWFWFFIFWAIFDSVLLSSTYGIKKVRLLQWHHGAGGPHRHFFVFLSRRVFMNICCTFFHLSLYFLNFTSSHSDVPFFLVFLFLVITFCNNIGGREVYPVIWSHTQLGLLC